MLPTPELSIPIFVMISLTSICCSWLGTFFIVQGKALVSDAMSHTVLPGIVIAFLLTGSKQLPIVFLGAFLASYFTSYAIDFIAHHSIIKHETATAVVLTVSFSIGIALLSLYGGNIDLDQECVLFGEVGYIVLEPTVLALGSLKLGTTPLTMLGLTVFVLLTLGVLFHRLSLISFDPILAKSLGVQPRRYQNLLIFLLAATLVTAFESVGAILSVALVIIPPATARLFHNRISGMLISVTILSLIIAYLGTYASYHWNLSTGSIVATGHGVFFFACLVFVGPCRSYFTNRSHPTQGGTPSP